MRSLQRQGQSVQEQLPDPEDEGTLTSFLLTGCGKIRYFTRDVFDRHLDWRTCASAAFPPAFCRLAAI